MTRTLADMTPEERADCVGMWASDGDDLGIIGRIYDSGTAQLIFPDTYQTGGRPLHAVTPHLDLPRAWTPSGEPVPGEWKEGHMRPYDGNVCACGSSTGCPGDTPVRRYITDWEVPHEPR